MSEWKESSVARRDFRSGRNEPEVPKRGGLKRKKDTKRWCRGKVGKEHNLFHFKWYAWMHVDKCRECGKEVKSYFRWGREQTFLSWWLPLVVLLTPVLFWCLKARWLSG